MSFCDKIRYSRHHDAKAVPRRTARKSEVFRGGLRAGAAIPSGDGQVLPGDMSVAGPLLIVP